MLRAATGLGGVLVVPCAVLAASIDDAPDCEDLPSSVTLAGVGLSRPESIVWDPVSGYWYQGNQASLESATDGFITRINADFTVDTLKWASGLGNPSGLRVFDGRLYAADSSYGQTIGDNGIVVIDVATGTRLPGYPIGPSTSAILGGGGVNDPVVDPSTGSLYVSVRHRTLATAPTTVLGVDVVTGAVTAVAPLGAFGDRPNGLLRDGHGLVVVNANGAFWRVGFGPGGPSVHGPCPSSLTQLDGLERHGDDYLFTRNGGAGAAAVKGVLARIRFGRRETEERYLCTLEPGEQAADLGVDPEAGIVAIPHLNTGKVTFVSLHDAPGVRSDLSAPCEEPFWKGGLR
jgi:hypothetical protein